MIQIYTGNGKGKTTAALGLCLRAAGAGKSVFFGQFLKGRTCSELLSLKKMRGVRVEQFGSGQFVKGKPSAADIKSAERGFLLIKKAVLSGKFGVVIMDEINTALDLGMLNIDALLLMLGEVPQEVEIVLTGRNAPQRLIDQADLVSEIKDVKHYFRRGIKARKGIEF